MSFEFDNNKNEYFEPVAQAISQEDYELTSTFRNLLDSLDYGIFHKNSPRFHRTASHPNRNNFSIRKSFDGYEIVYASLLQSQLKIGQPVPPEELIQRVNDTIEIFVCEFNYEHYNNFVLFCDTFLNFYHGNLEITLDFDFKADEPLPIKIPCNFGFVNIVNNNIHKELEFCASNSLSNTLLTFIPCSMSYANEHVNELTDMNINFSNIFIKNVYVHNCPYRPNLSLKNLPKHRLLLNIHNLKATTIDTQPLTSKSLFKINYINCLKHEYS